ncbi:HAD-IC family P-type ATPase [Cognatiluteimonas telluris]|uniref:HAD-IC family P-type ATPase n=1 Tax=Cognatiluteimonas telluris TaxID=1104775 RepID=UPI00140D8D08|nr:HAD-IC family P-type ATPase [Lysobacter telluris]
MTSRSQRDEHAFASQGTVSVANAGAGLGSVEAAARLRRDGPNTLPQPDRRSPLRIVASVLREPMLLLLLAATAAYVVLGDAREAMLLAGSVLLVVGLTIYQERKSERALEALRELGTPDARVIRDGVAGVVRATDLVVGDVIVLAEGDRVPADGRLLEANDLAVDESLLTGESVPLSRQAGADADASTVHASTLVVRGHAVTVVQATGARTAVGRIGIALQGLHVEATPMQLEIRRVVVLFAILALAGALLVMLSFALTRGGWLDAVLAGLTIAIASTTRCCARWRPWESAACGSSPWRRPRGPPTIPVHCRRRCRSSAWRGAGWWPSPTHCAPALPTRSPAMQLLGWPDLARNLAHGAAVFTSVVAAYALGHVLALPASQVGALAFTAQVMGNLGLIVVYRSGGSLHAALRTPNAAFAVVAASALAMLVVVTQVAPAARWFGFTPPPRAPWLFAGTLPLLVAAMLKAGRREAPAAQAQCENSTGTDADSSSWRVAPPSAHSRKRE